MSKKCIIVPINLKFSVYPHVLVQQGWEGAVKFTTFNSVSIIGLLSDLIKV
jgi:hypothetical protein